MLFNVEQHLRPVLQVALLRPIRAEAAATAMKANMPTSCSTPTAHVPDRYQEGDEIPAQAPCRGRQCLSHRQTREVWWVSAAFSRGQGIGRRGGCTVKRGAQRARRRIQTRSVCTHRCRPERRSAVPLRPATLHASTMRRGIRVLFTVEVCLHAQCRHARCRRSPRPVAQPRRCYEEFSQRKEGR